MEKIALRVTTWGDGLAVRLPDDYAKRAGIRDGDRIEVVVASDDTAVVARSEPFDRAAFVRELRAFHNTMSIGESVVERMRRENRY